MSKSLSELKRLALTEPDPRVQAQYAAELVRKADESARTRKRSSFYDDGFRDGKAGNPKAPPADYRGTTVNAQDYEDGFRDGEAERKAGKSARPAMRKADEVTSADQLSDVARAITIARTSAKAKAGVSLTDAEARKVIDRILGNTKPRSDPEDVWALRQIQNALGTAQGADMILSAVLGRKRQTQTAYQSRGKAARPAMRKANSASLPNVIRDVKQMAQEEAGAKISDAAAEWIIGQIVGRNPANYEKVYSVSTALLKRLIQQAQDKGL